MANKLLFKRRKLDIFFSWDTFLLGYENWRDGKTFKVFFFSFFFYYKPLPRKIKNSVFFDMKIYKKLDRGTFMTALKEFQNKLDKKIALGELFDARNPSGGDISLSNTALNVDRVYFDKTKEVLMGDYRLLDTDMGNKANCIMKHSKLKIGIRALCNTDELGNVTSVYKIFGFDLYTR